MLPEMRQVGYELPNFQQVCLIYAKLAVSMAIQAILGVFPAALFRQYQLGVILAALFQQRHPEHQPNCPLERGAAVEVYWYMLGHERMWGARRQYERYGQKIRRVRCN